MTTSVFFSNMAWVFLFANWVLSWNWREKFSDFRHNRPLHAILAVAGVTLIWSIGTRDLSHTLYVLQIGLPFLAIPLVVLTSKPLDRREGLCVAACYVAGVFAMTIVGLVRYLTIPDLPYRDIVPHISHIRFGLHLCFCIVLLLVSDLTHSSVSKADCSPNLGEQPEIHLVSDSASNRGSHSSPKLGEVVRRTGGVCLVLWFLFFIFLIHAYTSIIILLVLALVMPLACWRRLAPKVRWLALSAGVAAWLAIGGATLYYHHEYYTLRTPSTDAVRPPLTANGNPYLHRQDGLIENGNYVHQYVCEQEMREQWRKLSDYPFDSLTPVGYTVYPALLRYLNAIGATKDSLGMTHLTPDDVAAIEHGVANPVYLQRDPRKLFYVLFYEYENYRCFRSVSNFSTLQRLELWRAGWTMHRRAPLLGYGTGGIQQALQDELRKTQSPLAGSNFHLHNQYLTFLVAFGWVGLLIIAFFFVRCLRQFSILNSQFSILLAHIVIVLVSFMADNTLATLAGITFVTLPFSLLIRNEELGMRN